VLSGRCGAKVMENNIGMLVAVAVSSEK